MCAVIIYSNAMLRRGSRWGGNSAPQTSWLGFGERKGMGNGRGKGWKKRRKGKKANEKEVKWKRGGGNEKGTKRREGGGREKGKERRKMGRGKEKFCAVVIFPKEKP